MFKFLKEKLKKAVSVFSKKVKSEVEEPEEEAVEEKPKKKPKKEEKKKEKPKKKEEKKEKKKEKKAEKKKKAKKEEVPEEIVEEKEVKEEVPEEKEEKPEEIVEEKEEIPEETKEEAPVEEEKKEKKGFFKKLFRKKEKVEAPEEIIEEKPEEIKEEIEEKEGIPEGIEEEKPKRGILKKAADIFTKKTISDSKFEDMFYDLEIILLENNVAVEVIEKIKNDLKKTLVGVPLPRGKITEKIIESLRTSIKGLFDVPEIKLLKAIEEKKEKPYIISFIGVNGSGKTTTLAKIANLCLKNKLEPVMVASDTFRAAAIQQLEEHANKLKVKIIKHDYGSDAAAVAFDGIEHAKAKKKDVVLIDTAGRLQTNINLMDEMKKINRVAKPDLTIFVGESITGNDCIEQAIKFNEAVEFDAIILTKADVDEKGGASISVSYVTGKPIIYIGTGQTYDDLEKFSAQKVIESLGL